MLAQAETASVAGGVSDGWLIPVVQADITLTGTQSSAAEHATSNASGGFSFTDLAPGKYDLVVKAAGFKSYARFGLDFPAGKSALSVRLTGEKEDVAASPDTHGYEALFQAGRTSYLKGDMNAALRQFQSALAVRRDFPPILLGLGQIALRYQLPLIAYNYAQQVLQIQPGDVSATLLVARADARMGEATRAADLLQEALKDNPYDTDLMSAAGSLKLDRKEFAAAQTFFSQAYAMDPQSLHALSGLAEVQLGLNQPEKAVDVVASEAAKHPERADLRRELANIKFRVRQYDPALVDYAALLEIYKNEPKQQAEIYWQMGAVQRAKNDPPHAIESYQKAVRLSPETAPYAVSLAAAYEAEGKTKDAMKAYQDALKLESNPYSMNNLAYLMVKYGSSDDTDEALRLVEFARRQLPDRDEVNDTLGLVYLKKEMVDSACRVYEDLVVKAPSNPLYHLHYGMALAQKGDKPAALKQLGLAREDKPDKQDEKEIDDLIQKLSKAK